MTRVVWLLNLFRQKEGSNWASGKVQYKPMRKSDWYRDQAADSDRKARATTKLATRDRHIKDRDRWLEIAASVRRGRCRSKSNKVCRAFAKSGTSTAFQPMIHMLVSWRANSCGIVPIRKRDQEGAVTMPIDVRFGPKADIGLKI